MNLQLPKFLELVGLGYTSWFVYRYLLFKVSFSIKEYVNVLPDVHNQHVQVSSLESCKASLDITKPCSLAERSYYKMWRS